MRARVYFKDGSEAYLVVNFSYSRDYVIYYNVTLNALNSSLDYKAGETKVITNNDIYR